MKRLLRTGILALSIALSSRFTPANNLEKKVEQHSYDISCIAKVGASEFYYTEENNKYTIKINATTKNLFNADFFNKNYILETNGIIKNENYLPEKYTFMSIDKKRKSATEVIQRFDFYNLRVNSNRDIMFNNQKKAVYNKSNQINEKTRDILSSLMELRANPENKHTLNIVEEGENKKFDSIYEGIETIIIKNKTYQAHKIKIIDQNKTIKDTGESAILYLNTQNSDILKLVIKDYFISGITIELSN